ncbi:MAG: hypothetical protein ABGX16_12360 [Pirellulales bacterium]
MNLPSRDHPAFAQSYPDGPIHQSTLPESQLHPNTLQQVTHKRAQWYLRHRLDSLLSALRCESPGHHETPTGLPQVRHTRKPSPVQRADCQTRGEQAIASAQAHNEYRVVLPEVMNYVLG